MALPALLKTWEYRYNIATGIGNGGQDESHWQVFIDIKNVLTDTIAHGFKVGSISQVSGTTWRITGITQFTALGSMVGKTIKLRGMSTGDNNGDFIITAVPSATEIQFTNSNPTPNPESVNGSYNVIGGNFTNPWILDHTVKQPATSWVGSTGDGIDALVDYSDWYGDLTNFSQWCIRNPVTGTYWSMFGDCDSTAYRERMVPRASTAPNQLFAGGAVNVAPYGTVVINPEGSVNAHKSFEPNSTTPFPEGAVIVVKLHCQMSNDGQHTRLFATYGGQPVLFWMDETVLNPHPQWATGETPVITVQADGNDSQCPSFNQLNDTALCIGTTIPSANSQIRDRHVPDVYLSAEGFGSATNAENLSVPNELTGEWPLYPIGIVCNEIAYKSRIGQLKDIWWTSGGTNGNEYIPDDLSRQFLVVGDMVLPHDGSLVEWS
jgi:hypothetical protein